MKYGDEAARLFEQGYNCAQSTAGVFAADYGFPQSTLLKSMAGFGAGLGGLRETCGAVSAMAYIAGLHQGDYSPDDLNAKTALYELVRAMIQRFEKEHGTICCRELLERAGCAAIPTPTKRTSEYYAQRPCSRLVASAAEMIAASLHLCDRQLNPAERGKK